MNEAAQTVLTFVAMGGLCVLLERLWPQDPAAPRWRTDSLTDVLYFALRIALSAGLALATGLAGNSLPEQGPSWVATLPLAVQVVAVLFLSDFIQYWAHMAMHRLKPLWHVHAVHHSPEAVDWLVAARVHPFELAANKAAAAVPLYLIGFSPASIAVAVPLAATYSLLLHSNLWWSYGPLGYVIASPAFHRWHHSSDPAARDKNYAQTFSFIDFAFGTAYFPRGRKPERYGLVSGEMPPGIWRQFLYPIRMWLAPAPPAPGGDQAPARAAAGPRPRRSARPNQRLASPDAVTGVPHG